MKTFYIETLGCEKNTVDSEGAAGIFIRNSILPCTKPGDADFILINTCGFILDAKKQSIDAVLSLAENKKDSQKLIVSGCLSQRYAAELLNELPEVDYFLGVDDYYRLEDIIKDSSDRNSVGRISQCFVELPRNVQSGFSASIKIAEGCSNACSYCAIPFMKGHYRSRHMENIIDEAKRLADSGVKELIVIAQDITNYGLDLYGQKCLSDLLKKLCAVEGIKWVRLMYAYEDEIDDELIQCIKNEEKICHYIDIPIQHCSDHILRDMNRKSTQHSIIKTVNKLRAAIPDIAIRTTLITGLPGESREDFIELRKFVSEMRFDRLGCFAYSKEEGTKAAKMPGQVRKDVKERRRDRIMELQRMISLENNTALIGKEFDVLIDGKEEAGFYSGRTYMDAPEIDNSVLVHSSLALNIGDFVKVRITDAFDYDLCAEVI